MHSIGVVSLLLAHRAPASEPRGVGENSLELIFARIDDFSIPQNWIIDLEVALDGVAGVTGVGITTPGGTTVGSFDEGDNQWYATIPLSSFAQMSGEINGTWTIQITGASPSTTTFAVDTSAMVESDFYPAPSGLSPANGDDAVPADTTFSWIDPTGPATADALLVAVCGDDCVDDTSVFGTLTVDDTSWTPPMALATGSHEFEVVYADFFDGADVSPFNVTSGAINWDPSAFAPDGYPENTPLVARMSATFIQFEVSEAVISNNNMLVSLLREDIGGLSTNWQVGLFVEVPDVFGVTFVEVLYPNGNLLGLADRGDGCWDSGDRRFDTFAELKDFADGVWQVNMMGSNSSTTLFTLSTDAMVEGEFYATPTNLTPAHGAVDVAGDATFAWTDPATGSADLIAVSIFGLDVDYDAGASSIDTTLDVTETSWTPDETMTTGDYEWEIVYADFDSDNRMSTLDVVDGSIVWNPHPAAPVWYPAESALLLIGSVSGAEFSSTSQCEGDTNGSGGVDFTDLIGLLAGWGPCGGCAEDINGDGAVGFNDLLILLAAWGPC